MKRDDNLYIAKVEANKKFDNGVTRNYSFTMNVYALDKDDAQKKLEEYVSSRSVRFEVTHKLISFELSEPLAPRGLNS